MADDQPNDAGGSTLDDEGGSSAATSIITDVPLPMPTPSPGAAAPGSGGTTGAAGGDGSESIWKNNFGIVIPPDTRNQGGISLKASEFPSD